MPTRTLPWPSSRAHSCSRVYRRSSGVSTRLIIAVSLRVPGGPRVRLALAPGIAEVARVEDGRNVGLREADRVPDPSERARERGGRDVEVPVCEQHDRHHQCERRDLSEEADVDTNPRDREEDDPRREHE